MSYCASVTATATAMFRKDERVGLVGWQHRLSHCVCLLFDTMWSGVPPCRGGNAQIHFAWGLLRTTSCGKKGVGNPARLRQKALP